MTRAATDLINSSPGTGFHSFMRESGTRQIKGNPMKVRSTVRWSVCVAVISALLGFALVVPASAAKSPERASSKNLSVRVVGAGAFRLHDPANECGAFGTATVVGGSNCYLVVQFVDKITKPVIIIPADLRMTDYSGNTYSIENVLPKCYDTVDVDAPAVLKSHGRLTVQLCYPVATGTLPHYLVGEEYLSGIKVSVPVSAVKGLWGGA